MKGHDFEQKSSNVISSLANISIFFPGGVGKGGATPPPRDAGGCRPPDPPRSRGVREAAGPRVAGGPGGRQPPGEHKIKIFQSSPIPTTFGLSVVGAGNLRWELHEEALCFYTEQRIALRCKVMLVFYLYSFAKLSCLDSSGHTEHDSRKLNEVVRS